VDQDCTIGEYGFGICIREGLGLSVDKVKAVKYFRRSAAQGYGYGQALL
jgi:TPR repeat protein